MTLRCFHLAVASPTNDCGPDFLLVDLDEDAVRRIRALWAVLQTTDADAILFWDRRPDWYRGDPEYAAEEIFAGGEDFDLVAFLDRHFEPVNVQGSRLVVSRHGVCWEAESTGGDLFRSAPIPLRELVSGVGLVSAANPGGSPLERLLELTTRGVEFPDALWRVTQVCGLAASEAEALKQEYDLACAGSPLSLNG
jgi:hypothetical protein